MSTRILAILHPGGGTSGDFHDGARAAGRAIEEWTPAERAEPPRPLAEYGGVVVLGGEQNVCEQDRDPYLAGELDLLAEWLAGGRPALGVCLGAQLIAQAAGGRVVRAGERELGWLAVEALGEAAADPLLGFAPAGFTALQWHSYAVEPPAGAVALARSPVCLQAYRLGEAWGVQYHPEVTEQILADWIAELLADPREADPARAAERLRAGVADGSLARWNAHGRELFARFAARVG
jgi:GMP synthase-like glutamine amidotransferase